MPYRYDPAFLPKADLDAALTPGLLAHYPRRSLLAANAIGILPALQKLLALDVIAQRQPEAVNHLAVLKQRQLILAQVSLASSTVSSLAAELDCEGERADQQAGRLADLDDSTIQLLTVLSIVMGAIGGGLATISTVRRTQLVFGVGGGVIAAALSLLTLNLNDHTTDFAHNRNLLADVWKETPTSRTWPPSVWYMLTNPAFSNSGKNSLVHNTRERWLRSGQLGDPGSDESRQLADLLFGPGGTYTSDQLTIRANLLNEMQSSVRLLNQELQGLLLVLGQSRF